MDFLFVVVFVYLPWCCFVCLFQDKTEVRVFEVENTGENEKIVEISTGPKGSNKYLICSMLYISILREFVGAVGGTIMHQVNIQHSNSRYVEKVHTTTEYNTMSKNYIPISPQNTLFSLLSQSVCVYDVQSVLTLSINLLDQLQRTRPLG